MNPVTRRGFFQTAGLLAPLSSALAQGSNRLSMIGVQLYTVRDAILKKPLETLKAIDEIGYREVEAIGGTIPEIWPALEQTHLKGVSIHLNPESFFAADGSALTEGLDEAKRHDFEYAVFPWLDPHRRGGADVFHRLAATLNKAGEKAHKMGLSFCYHNHAFEFQPLGSTMPLEIIMSETDPKLVSLEMDVFWVSVAGHDPVKLLAKYSGRVPLIHLKDKAPGTPVLYKETVPRTAFREVGSGSLDFPGILRAAEKAGVKHYFVEQDQTPGDPVASLRKSFEYLHALRF